MPQIFRSQGALAVGGTTAKGIQMPISSNKQIKRATIPYFGGLDESAMLFDPDYAKQS
jgi:hypothetical protein